MRSFSIVATLIAVLAVAGVASSHERQEIAGMQVVFGGEPEPVLDGEICFLRWRFTDLESKEPVGDLEDLSATLSFDGKESARSRPGAHDVTPGPTRPDIFSPNPAKVASRSPSRSREATRVIV